MVPLLLAALVAGCTEQEAPASTQSAVPTETASEVSPDLLEGFEDVDAFLRGVDSVFAPLPLMRPGDEEALRRFGNAAQLEVARRIGIPRLPPPADIEQMQSNGSLVPIEDSEYWVVRELDYSTALGVPGLVETLEIIGEAFHTRLAEVGAPPLRFEISSVLRSADDQERLRQVNPNAALGESTHEYATTVDIAYNAFAAPSDPGPELPASPVLERYRQVAHERIAARRALEIKALLAEALQEVQNEGRIMVTLERLQPVFHLTIRD